MNKQNNEGPMVEVRCLKCKKPEMVPASQAPPPDGPKTLQELIKLLSRGECVQGVLCDECAKEREAFRAAQSN